MYYPDQRINKFSQLQEDQERKSRRRGFWKKVHVRPVTTESIETAESQYYSSILNRLSDSAKPFKMSHEKTESSKVTTYKPAMQFMEDLLKDEDEEAVTILDDIQKVDAKTTVQEEPTTEAVTVSDNKEEVTEDLNPGEVDLGTGSPDPTVMDSVYATTETSTKVDRSDGYSFMDYLFGVTSSDSEKIVDFDDKESNTEVVEEVKEVTKPKLVTTESTFVPDEITAVSRDDETTEGVLDEFDEIQKLNNTVPKYDEKIEDSVAETTKYVIEEDVKEIKEVETSSVSSFMDPMNIMSTSMSTEISHETEICFRGKCIKTSKDIL